MKRATEVSAGRVVVMVRGKVCRSCYFVHDIQTGKGASETISLTSILLPTLRRQCDGEGSFETMAPGPSPLSTATN